MSDKIEIPNKPGVTVMTPLQMNGVHFNKKHTVLTPQTLKNPSDTGAATPV